MRISPLQVEELGCNDRGVAERRLLAPLRFDFALFDHGEFSLVVPAGFVTDYASVPRPLWWLFPPDGDWAPAAVLHDWLWVHGICSGFLADALFRETMVYLGVPAWRRLAMYYAVRAYSVLFWRKR